jgi:hypothetical protein
MDQQAAANASALEAVKLGIGQQTEKQRGIVAA